MRPPTPSARAKRIVRAAEELFAARGIDGVSLREINRGGRGSNAGAVQYYFGDRQGLVVAVIERHRRHEQQRRHALLDHEAAGVPSLRALASALVRPVAAELADPDGGRAFLQIAAEYYVRASANSSGHSGSSTRASPGGTGCSTTSPPTPRGRRRSAFPATPRRRGTPGPHACLPRHPLHARRTGAPGRPRPRSDDEAFTSYLVDLVTALLATQPSRETMGSVAPDG